MAANYNRQLSETSGSDTEGDNGAAQRPLNRRPFRAAAPKRRRIESDTESEIETVASEVDQDDYVILSDDDNPRETDEDMEYVPAFVPPQVAVPGDLGDFEDGQPLNGFAPPDAADQEPLDLTQHSDRSGDHPIDDFGAADHGQGVGEVQVVIPDCVMTTAQKVDQVMKILGSEIVVPYVVGNFPEKVTECMDAQTRSARNSYHTQNLQDAKVDQVKRKMAKESARKQENFKKAQLADPLVADTPEAYEFQLLSDHDKKLLTGNDDVAKAEEDVIRGNIRAGMREQAAKKTREMVEEGANSRAALIIPSNDPRPPKVFGGGVSAAPQVAHRAKEIGCSSKNCPEAKRKPKELSAPPDYVKPIEARPKSSVPGPVPICKSGKPTRTQKLISEMFPPKRAVAPTQGTSQSASVRSASPIADTHPVIQESSGSVPSAKDAAPPVKDLVVSAKNPAASVKGKGAKFGGELDQGKAVATVSKSVKAAPKAPGWQMTQYVEPNDVEKKEEVIRLDKVVKLMRDGPKLEPDPSITYTSQKAPGALCVNIRAIKDKENGYIKLLSYGLPSSNGYVEVALKWALKSTPRVYKDSYQNCTKVRHVVQETGHDLMTYTNQKVGIREVSGFLDTHILRYGMSDLLISRINQGIGLNLGKDRREKQ